MSDAGKRVCVICGVSIEGRKHNAKTCSKACAREHRLAYQRSYAEEKRRLDGDEIRERNRHSYQRNRERRVAETKAYYIANRERIRTREKTRRAAEAEHLSRLAKARYEKNRETILARQRQRYAEDPEYFRGHSKQYAVKARAALKLIREIEAKGLEALL